MKSDPFEGGVFITISHTIPYVIFIMNEAVKPPLPSRRRSRSRSKSRSDNKPIRVWCPGTYDFMHYGQLNFLRKVKEEMSIRFPRIQLVAGIFSDKNLLAVGRQPVFTMDERFDMLRANKWVDDIVKDIPCQLSKEVLKETSCDYVFLFGQDEELIADSGEKRELMECGLLKIINASSKDYSDVSSNELINRLLLLEPRDINNNTKSGKNWNPKRVTFPNSISCKEILRFVSKTVQKPTDKVVYVDGSFDVLHPGHLNLLETAQSLGSFLLVGLHSDETISKCAGENFPIMQWSERAMALLSCKYVSDIIIDAPDDINESLLDAFSINCVVPSINDYPLNILQGQNMKRKVDRYSVAKARGIFHAKPGVIEQEEEAVGFCTTTDILQRVHNNWEVYSYATSNSQQSDFDGCETKVEQYENENTSKPQHVDGGECMPTLEVCAEGTNVKFRHEL